MPICPTLNSFTTQTIMSSANVNSNFTNLRDTLNTYAVLTDVARTVSVTHTFSASQTFSAGVAVTGNSTITGTLTALTGITSTGTAALAVVTVSSTLGVTGATTLAALACTTFAPSGTSTMAAVTCTTLTPSGLAQAGQQAAYKRYSGGDGGATPAFDWNNGNWQRFRLTANATPTFANPVKGSMYLLELQQDGTGSRTVTWSGATVAWADSTTPTLTTTANRKDLISLICVDATSTGTYLASVVAYNITNTTS